MNIIGRQCPECKFISTLNDPMYEENEIDEETKIETVNIVCPKCNSGFSTGIIIDIKKDRYNKFRETIIM